MRITSPMKHTERCLQSASVIKWNLYLYGNSDYRKSVRLHSLDRFSQLEEPHGFRT